MNMPCNSDAPTSSFFVKGTLCTPFIAIRDDDSAPYCIFKVEDGRLELVASFKDSAYAMPYLVMMNEKALGQLACETDAVKMAQRYRAQRRGDGHS